MNKVVMDDNFYTIVSRGTDKALRESGVHLRRAIRKSLLYRKNPDKASPPGKPPYTHTWLKKSVLWIHEKQARTVVVGPSLRPGRSSEYNAARLNEYGLTKPIKTRRVKYEVGKVGPVDLRASYLTPRKEYKGPSLPGVAFVKLKSKKQVRRANTLANILWPVKVRNVKFPERPFVFPAFVKTRNEIRQIFTNSVR